jgi:glycerophosphoryl diester phosphodiesterase
VPWTVNSLSDLKLVMGWQVDAITTDYPDRLLSLLS